MSIRTADKDPLHLYPVFREKLGRVLEEVASRTGEEWRMTEGYRSQERQLWLYGQGRPSFRPYGRSGNRVTWTLHSKHKSALAADVIPSRHGYHPPHHWWRTLRSVYQDHALENPAWAQGDFGHIQWPDSDRQTYVAAGAWVRAGFPETLETPPVPPPSKIQIFVNETEIPDAHGFLLEDQAWCALRPVTDALDWIIANVSERRATLLDGTQQIVVPINLLAGKGFCRVRDLAPLAARFEWDEESQSVRIFD